MTSRQVSFFDNESETAEKKDADILILEQLVTRFAENKTKADEFKKEADKDNARIKEQMSKLGLKNFVVGDNKVDIRVSETSSFIEEALIEKIKELKVEGVIKLKEYVDNEALENALYDGTIKPADLASTQTTKRTVALYLTKAKKEKK